ncbi:ABC transporter substrate-binding protein [Shewanella litorisediminis]|uniref:ABC transporter substrate-binding protein n=1 Tax=Shewanella litorisediminis TaxID=1173586 RepID=A0ABX7G3R1_9GAMM|nr:ABC transporter substrate-binding protein [Shewanella litorisediminis]MCL2919466.1 ABC transporter substrate-binding protein [Shewanella litorisediminis]QRH01924.1 ABC transporter substrate-binding protein [Shewanella litorisediminis]
MRNSCLLLMMWLLLFGCSEPREKIIIAINPWPGYEVLYLAEQQGLYEAAGLNVGFVQVATLSDAQRAYLSGRVAGFTSTMIEAVQVEAFGGKPVKVVLAADYSDGGDVILAQKDYGDIPSLKGKTIGCEVSSLGIFILARALAANGLTLDDVKVINVEQGDGPRHLQLGLIDAMVTYPPYSLAALKQEGVHQVFSTKEIPGEILDTLSISADTLAHNPDFVPKLRHVWQQALDYVQDHPNEAIAIMARREGIPSEDFRQVLNDIHLLDARENQALFDDVAGLENMARSVCTTLRRIDALESDCSHVIGMFDVAGSH